MYAINVNSIVDTCIAVPYHPDDSTIEAKEWIILKSRDEWYTTFLSHMEKELQENIC